jgi:hypothetical protein
MYSRNRKARIKTSMMNSLLQPMRIINHQLRIKLQSHLLSPKRRHLLRAMKRTSMTTVRKISMRVAVCRRVPLSKLRCLHLLHNNNRRLLYP